MIYKSVVEGVDAAIFAKIIPTFRTKKAATEHGKKYGWNDAFRVNRRFESVWVVGKKDFQPTYIGDLRFDTYRLPLFQFENAAMKIFAFNIKCDD